MSPMLHTLSHTQYYQSFSVLSLCWVCSTMSLWFELAFPLVTDAGEDLFVYQLAVWISSFVNVLSFSCLYLRCPMWYCHLLWFSFPQACKSNLYSLESMYLNSILCCFIGNYVTNCFPSTDLFFISQFYSFLKSHNSFFFLLTFLLKYMVSLFLMSLINIKYIPPMLLPGRFSQHVILFNCFYHSLICQFFI